jgi:hypothetical protein
MEKFFSGKVFAFIYVARRSRSGFFCPDVQHPWSAQFSVYFLLLWSRRHGYS